MGVVFVGVAILPFHRADWRFADTAIGALVQVRAGLGIGECGGRDDTGGLAFSSQQQGGTHVVVGVDVPSGREVPLRIGGHFPMIVARTGSQAVDVVHFAINDLVGLETAAIDVNRRVRRVVGFVGGDFGGGEKLRREAEDQQQE